MSFIKGIKRAFGFSEEEEFVNTYDDETSELSSNNNSVADSSPTINNPIADTTEYTPEDIRTSELFDGVIKVFNDALPEYFKTCLDIEAQRKYIYDNLDESLKAYLVNARNEAAQVSEQKWQMQSNAHRNELLALQEQVKTLEAQQGEAKKLQLSAERQKRALSERVHDLESQVASFEAEKEQFQLENSCLVNKLKVANVKEGEIEGLRQEVADLQMKLLQARNGDSTPVNDELQAKVAEAEAEVAKRDELVKEMTLKQDELIAQIKDAMSQIEILNEKIVEKDNQIESQSKLLAEAEENIAKISEVDAKQDEKLIEKVAELEAENKQLNEAVEQLKTKTEMAETMVANQNKNASDAIEKLAQADEQIKKITEERDTAVEEVAVLKEKIQLANEEIESSHAELEEVRSNLKILDEIEGHVQKFEEIKKKKDNQIAELKEKVKQLETEAVSMKEKNEELNKELENAKSLASVEFAVSSSEVKISAIDESLDDINWLEPGPPKSAKKQNNETEDQFGYKAPAKKVQPESDAQMSLFE